jgi:transposase-like protein
VTINGQPQYLWRAVDQDGDQIDILVQPRRDGRAARRFFRRLSNSGRQEPVRLVSDKLGSPMTRRDTRTIGPKSRTNPRDNESARCEVSNQQTTRSISCTSTVSFRIYFEWVDTCSGRFIIVCCKHDRSLCGPR